MKITKLGNQYQIITDVFIISFDQLKPNGTGGFLLRALGRHCGLIRAEAAGVFIDELKAAEGV